MLALVQERVAPVEDTLAQILRQAIEETWHNLERIGILPHCVDADTAYGNLQGLIRTARTKTRIYHCPAWPVQVYYDTCYTTEMPEDFGPRFRAMWTVLTHHEAMLILSQEHDPLHAAWLIATDGYQRKLLRE
jgi:hypothetical protein